MLVNRRGHVNLLKVVSPPTCLERKLYHDRSYLVYAWVREQRESIEQV
jgi:hypothetical protein